MFLNVLSFTAMILLHVETVFLLILGCIVFHIIVLVGSSYEMNAVMHSNTHTVCFQTTSLTHFYHSWDSIICITPLKLFSGPQWLIVNNISKLTRYIPMLTYQYPFFQEYRCCLCLLSQRSIYKILPQNK